MNAGVSKPVTAAVALGSNVGDRESHIAYAFLALSELPGTRLTRKGPVIQTAPIGRPGQDPGGPYLNSAAILETALSPRSLLDHLHRIERSRGRNRRTEAPWGPRTLDLDLLVYAEKTINEPHLTIPHSRMHERRFVLEPLAAIAPHLVVPGRGTVAELLRSLGPAAG